MTTKTTWVVDEDVAHGITRRFVLRKEIQTPKTRNDIKPDPYARFSMLFGPHENPLPQPHKHKRLSVLDECEEDLERTRKSKMFYEDWENKVRQSVLWEQALNSQADASCQKSLTTRHSLKNRMSEPKLKIVTSPIFTIHRPEEQDMPSPDRTTVKTGGHTALVTYGPPSPHQHSWEDARDANMNESISYFPLNTSLEPGRERIQRLFEDDLHRKGLEMTRKKHDVHHNRFQILQGFGEIRRTAVAFEYRFKRLNGRVTTLLSKHVGRMRK
ncbi:hypothetical protein FKW77_002921 [Venturia effusa]|uniref:Uncharacterized protein n=1 Tax=Venturia effusa TaxID=50376 RepID=A0A517L101_9PEZI|nr:hypothetical protein FKW77_002921 [Venturia effusa]